MNTEDSAWEDWERLLSAERHLQSLVPGTVLVGETAAALHAGHRTSVDGDHVVTDLRERFDEILQRLEQAARWQTARIQRPVLVLGQLQGVLTGIRQLRRATVAIWPAIAACEHLGIAGATCLLAAGTGPKCSRLLF